MCRCEMAANGCDAESVAKVEIERKALAGWALTIVIDCAGLKISLVGRLRERERDDDVSLFLLFWKGWGFGGGRQSTDDLIL